MGLGKLFKGNAEAKKGQKLRPVVNRQISKTHSSAAADAGAMPDGAVSRPATVAAAESVPDMVPVVDNAAQSSSPAPETASVPAEPQTAVPGQTTAVEQPLASVQTARAKITNMIYKTVCKGCQTQRGVHVETALSSLGALAGFGCQMAVREGMIKPGLISTDAAFAVVETAAGHIYYYGDMLNQPLFEAPVSVYSLIRAGIERAGAGEYPDIDAIAGHVADTLGQETFGVLTVPKMHQPLITPMESLKRFWPVLFAQIRPYYADKAAVVVEPTMLGWLFAEAARRLIVEAKDIVPPPVAGRIAFEAAVMMSKMDYRQIMPDYV